MTRLADLDPDTVGTDLELTAQSLTRRLGGEVVITSKAALEQAVMDRSTIGDAITSVEKYFEPLKRMAHELHATLCARERVVLTPLRALDKARSAAITDFKVRDDHERRERERALEAQERHDAQARATAEAAALESSGQPELAAAVLAEAINAPAPTVVLPSTTTQVDGLKFRRRWRWRYPGGPNDVALTPPALIARTLAIIPREYLTVDEKRLGAVVRAMKSAGKIPGVDIYSVHEPVR